MKKADRATINEWERKLGELSLKNIIKKEIRHQRGLVRDGVMEPPRGDEDEAYDYVYGWYDDYRRR